MAPITGKPSRESFNKEQKQLRKQWKQDNLMKKLKKQAKKNQEDLNKVSKQTSTDIEQLKTVSIAVPGSILENAQNEELETYLAGQIARAACIFKIDEVIIFDDLGTCQNKTEATIEDADGFRMLRQSSIRLGRILQYLECPQYLRKYLFPIHKDLQFAGLLNPLDAPHHLRQKDDFLFREGLVTNKPIKNKSGSLVNVGLLKEVYVDKILTPGVRCTVKLLPLETGTKKRKGCIVSPSTPTQEKGVYWGYKVRLANSLSEVFSKCSYKEGYDVTIGTSDKGTSVYEVNCCPFKHMLIVFGGLNGLEGALENDSLLNVDDPRMLFDYYLNTLPCQGSRTIRTEEAILISLTALKPIFCPIVTS